VTGQWFSLGTSVSSTNKTDCHDITEILLKVALIDFDYMTRILELNIFFSDILSHTCVLGKSILSIRFCNYSDGVVFKIKKNILLNLISNI
jgi:hypothetical protein